MLSHQNKSTFGQSSVTYIKFDDELTEIPTDIPLEVVEVRIISRQINTIRANTFTQLSQCTLLRLGSNISEIEPGSFNGLSIIRHLDLSSNNLTTIKAGTFQGPLSVIFLYLNNNNIFYIEENVFSGLKTLEVLYLQWNKLEILYPGIFCGLDSLTRLYLHKNHLTSISVDVFNHLPRPLELDVLYNPLQCDAALCWMKQEELNGTIRLKTYIYDDFNVPPKCVNKDWGHLVLQQNR